MPRNQRVACQAERIQRLLSLLMLSTGLLGFSVISAGAENTPPEVRTEQSESEPSKESLALCEKLLPYGDLFSEQELQSRFKRALVEPLGDRDLSFAVLLPKDWSATSISVTKEQLADDAHMQIPLLAVSPLAPKPEVLTQVRYMRVPEHVSPAQFVDVYARKFEAEVICRQHADIKNRQIEDALLKLKIDNLGDAYMRITASRRGERMFFIASSAPLKQYEIWKKTFAVSAVSFDLNRL